MEDFLVTILVKPGACPQPAYVAHAWFIKLFPEKCVSLPIYLSLSIRTGPREQTILVAKAALMQEIIG